MIASIYNRDCGSTAALQSLCVDEGRATAFCEYYVNRCTVMYID